MNLHPKSKDRSLELLVLLVHVLVLYFSALVLTGFEKFLKCFAGLDYSFPTMVCPAYLSECCSCWKNSHFNSGKVVNPLWRTNDITAKCKFFSKSNPRGVLEDIKKTLHSKIAFHFYSANHKHCCILDVHQIYQKLPHTALRPING